MKNKFEKPVIPLFFAVDDRYVPYLAVALRSIMDNASKKYEYRAFVLVDEVSDASRQNLQNMCEDNFFVEFVCVKERLQKLGHRLHLRDYYTKATYYRFFIPEMFPRYDKGIYLDCDIAVTGDIAELFETKLGRNLIGAITDEVVTDIPVFSDYAEKFLGIERDKYFNAGILVMNLREMRRIKIEERLGELMNKHTFTVAQDQDYLNVICYDRVKYLDRAWNKTPFPYSDKNSIPYIAHYKMDFKPWHYDGVVYEELFWKYAKKTIYYDMLLSEKENYSDERKAIDGEQGENLQKLALEEINRTSQHSFVPPIRALFLCGVR